MNQSSTATESKKNTPGAFLRQARINAEFNTEQVASRMNLTVELIKSIEKDDFDDNISPAFYRGYLRSYANIVSVDADELVQSYNQLINQGSMSASITPTFNTNLYAQKEFNFPFFKWFLYLAATTLVVFIGYMVSTGKFNSIQQAKTEIDLNSVQLNIGEEDPVTELSKLPAEAVDENDTITTHTAGSTANTPDVVSTIRETAVLEMNFKGDCWVKVVDATGEVLALGIKRSGKSMLLEGTSPFNIIMGNSAVVEIIYNQQAVDLSGFAAGNRVELEIWSDSELLQ